MRAALEKLEKDARKNTLDLMNKILPPHSSEKALERVASLYDLELPKSGQNEARRRSLVGQRILSEILKARETWCRERSKDFVIENSSPFRVLYWFYYMADLYVPEAAPGEKHKGKLVTVEEDGSTSDARKILRSRRAIGQPEDSLL